MTVVCFVLVVVFGKLVVDVIGWTILLLKDAFTSFIRKASSDTLNESDLATFSRVTKDIPNCEAVALSQDRFMKKFDHVTCYPWKQGIEEFFPELKMQHDMDDTEV